MKTRTCQGARTVNLAALLEIRRVRVSGDEQQDGHIPTQMIIKYLFKRTGRSNTRSEDVENLPSSRSEVNPLVSISQK